MPFNTLKLKNMRYSKVNYASFANGVNVDYDENLTPVKYSKCTYNFNYKNGALTAGLGVKDVKIHWSYNDENLTKVIRFPEGVQPLNVAFYRLQSNMDMSQLVFYCSDGGLYFNLLHTNTASVLKYPNITFTSTPYMFNYKLNGEQCFIVTSPNDGMWVITQTTVNKVADAPKITSCCLHYERLFVTVDDDKSAVWFSDDLDPTNWNVSSSEAGFIQMYDDRGDVLKVISFNDYVYIFREYGISRLTAYAVQEDFELTNLFVSSGKIYKDSIALCGDRIIFLASDGLYMFNGSSTTKLRLNIDNMFDDVNNTSCSSAFYNGNYYLACKLNFDDTANPVVGSEQISSNDNNALIQININSGDLSIARGVNIGSVNAINSHLINMLGVCIKDENGVYKFGQVDNCGSVFGVPTLKYWKSPSTDFGLPEVSKLIKDIYVNVSGDACVYVTVDGVRYKHVCQNYAGELKRIKVNLRGYKIAIDFESQDDNVYISNPQAVIGY